MYKKTKRKKKKKKDNLYVINQLTITKITFKKDNLHVVNLALLRLHLIAFKVR